MNPESRTLNVGLISDTHGRLPAAVFDPFVGVDRILHAGDIGPVDLLTELEAIAPVTAVSGNMDGGDVRHSAQEAAALELAGRQIVVVHGHQLGTPTPDGLRLMFPEADIIVFGHTHRPLIEKADGVLVVNPGSAGAPRFGMAASVAVLRLAPGEVPTAELIELA